MVGHYQKPVETMLYQVIGLVIANAISSLMGYWFSILNKTGSRSDLF